MAKDEGEQLVLGNSLTEVLQDLAGALNTVAAALSKGTTGALPPAGIALSETIKNIQVKLSSGYFLSDNTYTV